MTTTTTFDPTKLLQIEEPRCQDLHTVRAIRETIKQYEDAIAAGGADARRLLFNTPEFDQEFFEEVIADNDYAAENALGVYSTFVGTLSDISAYFEGCDPALLDNAELIYDSDDTVPLPSQSVKALEGSKVFAEDGKAETYQFLFVDFWNLYYRVRNPHFKG